MVVAVAYTGYRARVDDAKASPPPCLPPPRKTIARGPSDYHCGLLALAAGTVALAAAALASGAQEEPHPGGPLAQLWTLRGALQDTNGDGFADSTRLNIELLDASDRHQLAAAANVTARLGFETMSIDLPLAASPDGPTVIIGTAAPAASLLTEDDAEPRGYVFVGADSTTIHVWGDDATALAAATLWLSGRAPNLWGADSLTLAEASARILVWAGENSLPIVAVIPAGIAVRPGEPGVETLFIDIQPAQAPPHHDSRRPTRHPPVWTRWWSARQDRPHRSTRRR